MARAKRGNAAATSKSLTGKKAQTKQAADIVDTESVSVDEVYRGECSALLGRVAIAHSIARRNGIANNSALEQQKSERKTSVDRPAVDNSISADDDEREANLQNIMFLQREIEAEEVDESDDEQQHQVRVDYLLAANPRGKTRAVGAPKRNRKEQMSVDDQIRAGKELARAFGVVRCGEMSSAPDEEEHRDACATDVGNDNVDNEARKNCGKRGRSPSPPPPPPDALVDGNSSSDTALALARTARKRARTKYSFLRSIRAEETAKKRDQRDSTPYARLVTENEPPPTSATEHCETPPASAQSANCSNAVVRSTSSDQLRPQTYTVYDKTQTYEDEAFDEYASDAVHLSDTAVREYAARIANVGQFTPTERLEMAETAFGNSGYGRAAVTMEDFDITRAAALAKQDGDGVPRAHGACCYPTSTSLRCRYDHHCFHGIPVLLPLHYHAEKNILEVLPDVVFCSFACAMAYLQRDAPRLHHDVRKDRITMLRFMARKWFGVTERVRPAPLLQQQRAYGGRLSIEQFRALSATHHSFVEYPLAAAVPARYVTEIIVSRRMDRAKRQGLHLRVAEQHGEQVPEAPAALDIDPSAPAAPRGAEARARAARAKEARAKKLGAAGIALPDKKRTVTTENGERQTIDRAYVEQVIRKTAEQQKSKPKRRHALQHMMSVKKISPAKK